MSTRHWNVAALGRGEGEVGVVSLRRRSAPGRDRRVRRDGVDGPRAGSPAWVDVAGGVDGADLEGVRALARARCSCAGQALKPRRRARTGTSSRPRSSVKVNVGARARDGAARAAGDRRVRRDGVDRPGAASRAWRRCCRRRRSARTWNVCAPWRGRCSLRRRAGAEGGGRRARHWNVAPVSVEVKVNVARRCSATAAGRAAGDRRVGRDRVDGPGARCGRGVDVADGVDRAHLEGVRALARARCSSPGRCVKAAPSSEHWNVAPVSVEV